MTTYFVSDLHLSEDRPEITRLLLDFLATQARQARALYILGDLFDLWVGDDHSTPLSEAVATGLRALSQQGVVTYFMRGNRDFLLGRDYADQCGMHLLADPTLVQLGSANIGLSHGDSLCTDDLPYQTFRREVRSPTWREAFLAKPVTERLAFADYARAQSKTETANKADEIMDVNPAAVSNFFAQHRIDVLIHGHTHRPAIHQLDQGRRIVLGDWHQRGSVLIYQVDSDAFSLEQV